MSEGGSISRRGLLAAATAAALPLPRGHVLRIATGDVTGLYYAFGSAIARLFSDEGSWDSSAITVTGTAGSVANLIALRDGAADVALVRPDSAQRAWSGTDPGYAGRPLRDLRLLFAAMPESLTLLAARDSGIRGVADLRGRTVDFGEPGSGTRQIADALVRTAGLSPSDLKAVLGLRGPDRSAALCGGRMDAAIFMTGHPALPVLESVTGCGTALVPVGGPAAASLLRDRPFYHRVTIPAGIYRDAPATPVPTIGANALVCATAALPDATAYALTRAMVERIDDLRRLHLAFAQLTARDLASECGIIPLHPGAERYLRRKGLLAACRARPA